MDFFSPEITKTTTTSTSATDLVTVDELGAWLNLSDSMITAKTSILTSCLNSAVILAEKATWRNFLQRTFMSYFSLSRGCFTSLIEGDLGLVLPRSPIEDLDNITKIEYMADDETWTEFDRGDEAATGLFDYVHEMQEQRGWASIYFVENPDIDVSIINTYQVRVTYSAYYSTLPDPIKTAILEIAASIFTNRGDCGDGANAIPPVAQAMLDPYAIRPTVFAGPVGYGF